MAKPYRYFEGSIVENELVNGCHHPVLSVLVIARDKREAKKRYIECIERNSVPSECLKINPGLCELIGAVEMINYQFTEEMKAELETYNSVLYCINRKVLERILTV